MGDGARGVGEAPAVGKRIGSHVDDAHHQRPKRQRKRSRWLSARSDGWAVPPFALGGGDVLLAGYIARERARSSGGP